MPDDNVSIADLENSDTGGVIPGDEALGGKEFNKKEAPEKPKRFETVREAVKDAREKVKEKTEKVPDKAENKEPKMPDGTTVKKAEGDKKEEKKADKPDGAPKLEDKKPVEHKKPKTPTSWAKEAQDAYDSLPEVVRAAIEKREAEIEKGSKTYSDSKKELEAYDRLIDQYAPDHKQLNLTKPQVVERVMLWFNALRHPTKAVALDAFKQLAKNFNFSPDELQSAFGGTQAAPQPAAGTTQPTTTQAQNVSPEVQTAIQKLEKEIAQLREGQTSVAQKAGKDYVDNWAKDKPHFEKVKQSMHAILSSGQVPLKDGNLDLDTAYAMAVRQDEELYQEQIASEIAKKQAELLENQKSEAQRKADEIEKSKKAAVSLRTGASLGSQPATKKPNNKASPRDSILSAIREVRGT